ncbi:MAG TPA: hypothetical protein VND93_23075 [Myxococcales bacterium]|jgi:hypothetical protein|nr:hypothetical protein [Myxococcales bacterium]
MDAQASGQMGSVARVFAQQPDRVAAAWRRLRYAALPEGQQRNNLLDDVVEPFIKQVAFALEGMPGAPWARTQAVLRLSRVRGPGALWDELMALQRCLLDACEALGGTDRERLHIHAAVREALESANDHYRELFEGGDPPRVPFGGLVVEQYEQLPKITAAAATPALH